MPNITTVKSRETLKPRREPYWVRLAKGSYLGFRKMATGSAGTWIARYRQEHSGKQDYRALGDFSEFPSHERYDKAKVMAEAWAKHLGMGGNTDSCTVRMACERYVKKLRSDGRITAADVTESRFKLWVYSNEKFSARELTKLHKVDVREWRQRFKETPIKRGRGDKATTRPRSASSVNREMTALRSALNLALDDGLATSPLAWRKELAPIKNADRRRDLYLDKQQRRDLLTHAEGAIATFLKALCLVPLRVGALAALRACDFDPKLKTVTIGKDKHGKDRKISLPDDTAAFFEMQRKGKLPAAPLLADDEGGYWNKYTWNESVKKAMAAAGLPESASAYTLRHCAITDLVHAGLDTHTVATLSGTSMAMIEKYYGHMTDSRSREALATLAI